MLLEPLQAGSRSEADLEVLVFQRIDERADALCLGAGPQPLRGEPANEDVLVLGQQQDLRQVLRFHGSKGGRHGFEELELPDTLELGNEFANGLGPMDVAESEGGGGTDAPLRIVQCRLERRQRHRVFKHAESLQGHPANE